MVSTDKQIGKRIRASTPASAPMSEQTKALVGAIEMLQLIGEGQSYTALEFFERLGRYKQQALAAQPSLATDPYFGRIFKGAR